MIKLLENMLLSYIKKRLNLMKNKIIKSLILLIPIVLIFFAMTRENDPLYAPDSFLTDHLYSRLNGTDRNIVISSNAAQNNPTKS